MHLNGFIKLNREILRWRWYTDCGTLRVFLHLLLNANFAQTQYREQNVERGQVVTSVRILCEQLSMTTQQIRTALDHLKLTNDITIKATSKFSIITVNNYEKYAFATNEEQTDNKQATNKQQTNNKHYNNYKKNKKRINDIDEANRSYSLEDFEKKSLFTD